MSLIHRIAGAATLAALLLGIASSDGRNPTASAQTAPAACPAGLAIVVAAPTAAAPTTINATITPTLNLKAAALADPLSFHVHYYVDTDPTKLLKVGSVIPSGDPKIIHAGTASQDVGPLTPGSHTVWVVVGQVSHQACGGTDGNIVAGSTTFTVAAAQAVPAATAAAAPAHAPAKAGTGGVEANSNGMLATLALLGIAIVGVAGARRLTARSTDR